MVDYLLLQVIVQVQNTIGSQAFQKDHTPTHKVQIIQAFFDQNRITVKDWPAISPDLNPIEYVWVKLKCWIHIKYPDIKNTRGA
jgi:transposase